ncbi:MAG: DUF2017 family protein [Actinomycetaceae bacterium]|nr:DUF2017 family protein [Actinomycetaceae bacterium]
MRAFRAVDGGYSAYVSPSECAILLQAVTETINALDAPATSSVFALLAAEEEPRDRPVSLALTRLLPPPSTNAEAAAQLRALTEDDLRRTKTGRLQLIQKELTTPRGAGGCVFVPEGEVWTWLCGINDVRLALSGTLGILADWDLDDIQVAASSAIEPKKTDPSEAGVNEFISGVFWALAWWQDSLLNSMELAGKCLYAESDE